MLCFLANSADYQEYIDSTVSCTVSEYQIQ